jgi:hypothetical protein
MCPLYHLAAIIKITQFCIIEYCKFSYEICVTVAVVRTAALPSGTPGFDFPWNVSLLAKSHFQASTRVCKKTKAAPNNPASGGPLLFDQYAPFAILKPKNRKTLDQVLDLSSVLGSASVDRRNLIGSFFLLFTLRVVSGCVAAAPRPLRRQ